MTNKVELRCPYCFNYYGHQQKEDGNFICGGIICKEQFTQEEGVARHGEYKVYPFEIEEVKVSSALDVQVGGNHYKHFKIQPVEFIQKNELNHCEASIVKYATRHKVKNGKEDLLKIKHYVDLLIEMEYPDEDHS